MKSKKFKHFSPFDLIPHFLSISYKILLEPTQFPSIIMASRGMLRQLIGTKDQFARLDDRLDTRF